MVSLDVKAFLAVSIELKAEMS
ncbi:hypothetical protein CULT_1750010 [[Clostridium] ultunense Esp]|nr:hypothetical protein CULT_1750010 [[Clostridium] ultunense Esp]